MTVAVGRVVVNPGSVTVGPISVTVEPASTTVVGLGTRSDTIVDTEVDSTVEMYEMVVVRSLITVMGIPVDTVIVESNVVGTRLIAILVVVYGIEVEIVDVRVEYSVV